MKKIFGLGALVVACACIQSAVSAQQPTEKQFDKSQQEAPDNTGKNMRDKVCRQMTADNASNKKPISKKPARFARLSWLPEVFRSTPATSK